MPRRRIRTTTAIFISLPSWVFRFLSRLVRGATYNRGKKEERKEGRRGEGEVTMEEETKFGEKKFLLLPLSSRVCST